ncbi:MAG: hypothetical protein GY757_58100 [bacterium]|nr:hypothetical protein [bacterium]
MKNPENPKKTLKKIVDIISIDVVSDIIPCLDGIPVKLPAKEYNWFRDNEEEALAGRHNWEEGNPEDKYIPGVFKIKKTTDQSALSFLPDLVSIFKNFEGLENNNNTEKVEIIETISKDETSQSDKAIGRLNDMLTYIPEYCKLSGNAEKNDISGKSVNPQSSIKKRSHLNMEVKIGDLSDYPTVFLTGELNGIIFTGLIKNGGCLIEKCEIDSEANDKYCLKLFSLDEPNSFKRIWGDMKWYLFMENDEEIKYIRLKRKTPMEIFWIFDYPGKMFKRGVWVEVLRLLDMECHELTNQKDIVRRVVNYCHSGTGLRYDGYTFSTSYGCIGIGGAFNLKAYLSKTFPFVNCFDQAGAVQTLLGALGINIGWVLMDNYGYLNETVLVGRGQCNNTGFLYRGRPEMMPVNHNKRKGFGSHSFCVWYKTESESYFILDATAGPFFGQDTEKSALSGFEQAYIEAHIDSATNLYGPDNYMEPGRLRHMVKAHEGVTDVHSVTFSPFTWDFVLSSRDEKRIQEFTERIGFDDAEKKIGRQKCMVFMWNELLSDNIEEELHLFKTFVDTRVGIDIAAKQWTFSKNNESITIEVFVANSLSAASANILKLLALSSNHPRVPFEINPKALGHLHLSKFTPYYQIEQWRHFNVCVKVTAYNTSIDIDALTRKIQDSIEAKAKLLPPKNVKNDENSEKPAGEKNAQNSGESNGNSREDSAKEYFEDYLPTIKSFHLEIISTQTKTGLLNCGDRVRLTVTAKKPPLPISNKKNSNLELQFFLVQLPKRNFGEDITSYIAEHQGAKAYNSIRYYDYKEKESAEDMTFELILEGVAPGITEVRFLVASTSTLLCSETSMVAINVIERPSKIETTSPNNTLTNETGEKHKAVQVNKPHNSKK